MKDKRVLLIVGGNGSELEDSLAAASRLQSILPGLGYVPVKVSAGPELLDAVLNAGASAAIVCMAGPQASTGHIHAVLSMAQIPFMGPRPERAAASSSVTTSRKLLAFSNIPVPPYVTVQGGSILSPYQVPFTFPVTVRDDTSRLDSGEVFSSLKPLQHHVLSRGGATLVLEPHIRDGRSVAMLVHGGRVTVTAEVNGHTLETPDLSPVQSANMKTMALRAIDVLSIGDGPFIVHFTATDTADPVLDSVTVMPSLAPGALLERLIAAAGKDFTEWMGSVLSSLVTSETGFVAASALHPEETL